MLREILNVSQMPGAHRRWFASSFLDIIVWYDNEMAITGFQLCYDKGREEKALTWRRDYGYSHNRIDDGEGRTYRQKMTPILVADGIFEYKEVSERFKKESKEIDAGIAQFIYEKLLQFPNVGNKA